VTNILCAFLISPMRAIFPAHFIHLNRFNHPNNTW
jgi:hypothetical protein